MTGIAEGIAALTGIKAIADGFMATRDEAKVMEIKLDLMKRAFEIQQALNALQDELTTVKAQKTQLEQENLKLHQRLSALDEQELIQPMSGTFVLAKKPSNGELHRPPYFCHACHQDGQSSVLSFQKSDFDCEDFPAYFICPHNETHRLSLPGATQPEQLGYAR